jgi:hypothetical protein
MSQAARQFVAEEVTAETNARQLSEAAEISRFITAGKATFTIVSKVTGNRFTYQVKQSDNPTLYFVALLNGPDNTSNFAYLGTLGNGYWKHGAKSKISEDAPSAKGFKWFWANLKQGQLPATVEFWHEGRCCKCGRKLTVPSSIESGIGPECASRMGSLRVVGAS